MRPILTDEADYAEAMIGCTSPFRWLWVSLHDGGPERGHDGSDDFRTEAPAGLENGVQKSGSNH